MAVAELRRRLKMARKRGTKGLPSWTAIKVVMTSQQMSLGVSSTFSSVISVSRYTNSLSKKLSKYSCTNREYRLRASSANEHSMSESLRCVTVGFFFGLAG